MLFESGLQCDVNRQYLTRGGYCSQYDVSWNEMTCVTDVSVCVCVQVNDVTCVNDVCVCVCR